MILAAGRGERMGRLTADTPKPLLEVADKSLIALQIERLASAGFRELVINTGYLGERVAAVLGDGSRLDVHIQYSPEPMQPLGTGRGIQKALPLLGDDPFMVCNADVWTEYPFQQLRDRMPDLAHLVLVPNPSHHLAGDFALCNEKVTATGNNQLTYAGIAVLRPELFANATADAFELAPLLRQAAGAARVTGERFDGAWIDVGTPERLAELRALVSRTEKRRLS